MKIAPLSGINFGKVYQKKVEYSNTQLNSISDIRISLDTQVPYSIKKRTYADLMDRKGYDILLSPYGDKRICVNVVKQKPTIDYAHTDFYEMGDIVGIYGKDNPFNIDDVTKIVYRDNILAAKLFGLALLAPTAYIAIVFGLCNLIASVENARKEPVKVIEKAVQDSTQVAKDSLQLFKKSL